MTEEQRKWLQAHPIYSPVRAYPAVSMTGWANQGYLYEDGRFVVDDGRTLFTHEYPAWFITNGPAPMRVGREYQIC